MYFISVVYWMCDLVEIRRNLWENAKQGIKVGFVQFVKTIGLELVYINVHNVLRMMILTTLFS